MPRSYKEAETNRESIKQTEKSDRELKTQDPNNSSSIIIC